MVIPKYFITFDGIGSDTGFLSSLLDSLLLLYRNETTLCVDFYIV